MVKIIIGNIYSKVVGVLPDPVQDHLVKILSYRVPNARFMLKYKKGQWDGIVHLYYKTGSQTFFTGLLSLVRESLKKYNIPFELVDRRSKPDKNLPGLTFIPSPDYEERPYQSFTIDRAIKFTRGILCMATGAGKTIVVTRLISEIKTYPVVFYVLTKDLMEQAHGVLSSCLNEPIGKIGDGEVDIKRINVCTIQTAVMALDYKNKSFKISDYQFDDEDEWDEKKIESESQAESIKSLISSAKVIYVDECISGDSIVITETGPTKIDEIVKNKCRFVQTYDGNNVIYKPIKNWWCKGKKKTIDITLSNGEKITCTHDHLLFTKRGWIKAKHLLKTDCLFCVNAVVDRKSLLQINTGLKNSFLGIKLDQDKEKNGKRFTNFISRVCQNANVDVDKKFCQDTKLLKNLSKAAGPKQVMQNMSEDTISNQFIASTYLSQKPKKYKPYSEHAWETLRCVCRIKDLKITDCVLPTVFVRKNGQNIRLDSFTNTVFNVEKLGIKDLGNILSYHFLCVYQQLLKLLGEYTKEKLRLLRKMYLMTLEKSVLHGGFVTTDQIVWDVFHYIQRDGLLERIESCANGSIKTDLSVDCNDTILSEERIGICDSIQKDQNCCRNTLENMYQNLWDTNWKTIKNIKIGKAKKVYDIEVEDTHCFFANGILVHNCHHASAKTVKSVLLASPNAYWRYGGSATPVREDGASIVLQGMFGAKIVDINASYLIKKGDLVKPYIFMEPIDSDKKLHSYAKVYEQCVVKNDAFNNHVAETVNHLVKRDLSVLVLVRQYNHGEYLKKLIPNSEFITGKRNSETRLKYINDLRERKITLISTSLMDEGADIRGLDAVVMAGGGKSQVRVGQRIGRSLRKDKKSPRKKDKSIVIIYEHNAKYLDNHAKRIRSILKREPEFVVINSKGSKFICEEIDSVLGIKDDKTNLLNP